MGRDRRNLIPGAKGIILKYNILNRVGRCKMDIEGFNRSFRESILEEYLFEDIMQLQILAEEWVADYNSKRSHEALDGKIPLEYRAQWSLSMELALREPTPC